VSDSLPSADLRARVLDAVARKPAYARAAGARRSAASLALAFAFVSAGAAILASRPGSGPPSAYVFTLFASWAALACASTWAGVSRGRSMLGRPAVWRVCVVVVTPAALLATWLVVAFSWPQTMHGASGPENHVVCIGMTLLFAAAPLVAFAALARGSEPVTPRLAGAALGVACGAWGAAAHVLVCRVTAAEHMVLGHVLPVLFLVAIGAFIGDRVLAVRTTN
jgi:hypothetical protein